ncbi:MAG: hypothetical protein MUC96_17500 [Myxococcaceae bacterium]|jgi:hypothetical protein|nr:hypothetical protein [Myxococcaceae bacterium]
MLAGLLLSLALSEVPAPLRLVQFVQGVPVGVIEASVAEGRFHYRVRHVFRQQARVFETAWPVDAEGRDATGRLPELWLLRRRPAPGCIDVREERTGATERLCVEQGGGKASLDGVPVRLAYDGAGALLSADVLDGAGGVLSRFERSRIEPRADADPFGAGFVVTGPDVGTPVLRPGGPLARVAVEGLEAPLEGTCLVVSRAFASRTPGAAVQLGVLIEGGRAWPHAWVRLRDGRHLDPTRSFDEAARTTYVGFPDPSAGRWFLELASGARRLTFEAR